MNGIRPMKFKEPFDVLFCGDSFFAKTYARTTEDDYKNFKTYIEGEKFSKTGGELDGEEKFKNEIAMRATLEEGKFNREIQLSDNNYEIDGNDDDDDDDDNLVYKKEKSETESDDEDIYEMRNEKSNGEKFNHENIENASKQKNFDIKELIESKNKSNKTNNDKVTNKTRSNDDDDDECEEDEFKFENQFGLEEFEELILNKDDYLEGLRLEDAVPDNDYAEVLNNIILLFIIWILVCR